MPLPIDRKNDDVVSADDINNIAKKSNEFEIDITALKTAVNTDVDFLADVNAILNA